MRVTSLATCSVDCFHPVNLTRPYNGCRFSTMRRLNEDDFDDTAFFLQVLP